MWCKCTKMFWILVLAILMLGSVTSAQGATSHFSRFVGLWVAHGSSLEISTDGQATFEARTYRWCGHSVAPPCDLGDARGVIHAGNREQIQFSYIADSVAYGTIIASNFHPRGLPVTIELRPNDTLLYASRTPIALLCGPAAPVGMCGA
jgi:hypothetical protein